MQRWQFLKIRHVAVSHEQAGIVESATHHLHNDPEATNRLGVVLLSFCYTEPPRTYRAASTASTWREQQPPTSPTRTTHTLRRRNSGLLMRAGGGEGRADALAGEWSRSYTRAGRSEDCIGDCRRHGYRSRLAGSARRFLRPIDQHNLNLRYLREGEY